MNISRQDSIDFSTLEEALDYSPAWDICQIKYDGIWARLKVVANPVHVTFGEWYSRTEELKKQATVSLPTGVYLGEYMFGSHWSQQDEHNGKTYLFDILQDGDQSLRNVEYARRYSLLHDRVKSCGDPNIGIVANFGINLAPKLWPRVLSRGYEGVIFRHSKDPYDAKIGRLKREVTFEYVVMGIVEGRGKHLGRMGALLLGLYQGDNLVEICKVGGGFSDALRQQATDHPDLWLGKVVECKGQCQFPSGALRHPNYVRHRPDKLPEDCKWTPLTE